MRKTVFANGEYYHIYNRGVDKRDIFVGKFDFERFLQSMEEFNTNEPIGSIYENSFLKIQRSGALFQGPFKAVYVDSNEYLLHLSTYVNLNFKVHKLGGLAPKWRAG